MIKLAALAIVLGASACTLSPWEIGSKVDPQTVGPVDDPLGLWPSMVQQGIDDWSAATGCADPFVVSEDHTGYPVIIVAPESWDHRDEAAGYWDGDTIEVRGHFATTHNRVLLHELGHAFGLDHSNDPRDIMFNTPTVDELTESDVRAFEAATGMRCR